ncbi:MAG: hypothetical protein ACYDIE_08745 [Candidatus Krumholzibacteriia bacterium]
MTHPPRHAGSVRWLLTALAALLVAPSGGAAGPADGGVAAPPAGGRAAVALFFSSAAGLTGAVPLTALRQEGTRRFAALCAAAGLEPVAGPAWEPLQQRLRLRSPLGFDRRLLDAAAAELGATQVIIAQVSLHPGRLVATIRGIDTGNGLVRWAGVAETAVGPAPDAAAWLAALRRAGDELSVRILPPPAPGAATLLLLPAQVVDLDPLAGEIVTGCLLQRLLRDDRWRLPDPALVLAVLREQGRGPAALDSVGCRALRTAFGPAPVAVTEVIGWDPGSALATAVPTEAGPALRPPLPPFSLAWRLVDTRQVVVLQRAEVYLDAPAGAGWFGAVRSVSSLERYRQAVERLPLPSSPRPEDS